MLSWQQKKLYDNAAQIQEQTKVIHERIKVFHGHVSKIGAGLKSAVKAFNKSASSWDTRLMPAFKTIEEMGIADKKRELKELDMIQEAPLDLIDNDVEDEN